MSLTKELVAGVVDEDDDHGVLAEAVPSEWVREQLKAVGKTLQGEVQSLRKLEEHVKALRLATQDFADACNRPATDAIIPMLDKVRRSREDKLDAIKKLQDARTAHCKSEVATSQQLNRLTALVPSWVEGVAKGQIDDKNRR